MLKPFIGLMGTCLLVSACSTTSLESPTRMSERTPAGREQFDEIADNYNKPVLLIMAEMNSSNEKRESEMSELIAKAQPQIRFCFEKASIKTAADGFHVFYFSVDEKGVIGEISTESDRNASATKNFHVCMVQLLESLRATSSSQKLSFRFKMATLHK